MSVVALLSGRPSSWWSPRPPAPAGALEELERRSGVALPAEYRELLLHSDGGCIDGPSSSINLASTPTLLGFTADPVLRRHLAGALVIGDDGGGHVYFYDVANRLGRGRDAVCLVPLSSLDARHTLFVASSLAAAVQRACDGKDFLDEE
jgi:hypothetical protein